MNISQEELRNYSVDDCKKVLFRVIKKEKQKYSFAKIEEIILSEMINDSIVDLKEKLGKVTHSSYERLFIEIFEDKIKSYISNKVESLGPNEGLVKEFIDSEIGASSGKKML